MFDSLSPDHIGANLEPFLSSDSNLTDDVVSTPPKRQRKLAKLERQLLCCGRDIDLLCRFVNAQVVAFRKILKKYRVRTPSTSPLSPNSQTALCRSPFSLGSG